MTLSNNSGRHGSSKGRIVAVILACTLIFISGVVGFRNRNLFDGIVDRVSSWGDASYELTKLDSSGLYQMNYNQDYYLDDYLQSGSSSDSEFLSYLQNKFLDGRVINLDGMQTGCTSFVVQNASGHLIYGRNLDLQQRLSSVQVFTHPDDGYASVSTALLNVPGSASTSGSRRMLAKVSPYLPLDGMNEKGVAVSVLYVPQWGAPHDDGKISVGTLPLTRVILDRAKNIDEAIGIMRSYNVYPTGGVRQHYFIADSSGESAIVEFYDGDVKVIYSDKSYQVASNFIAYEGLNIGSDNSDFEFDRYRSVNNEIEKNNGTLSSGQAVSLLARVGIKKNNIDELQWSVVYDLTEKKGKIFAHRNTSNVIDFELN